MALIEIDGLPSYKMLDLSMAMLNNQMVDEPYGYGSKLGTPIIGWLILN